jgi:hypothetical protein
MTASHATPLHPGSAAETTEASHATAYASSLFTHNAGIARSPVMNRRSRFCGQLPE